MITKEAIEAAALSDAAFDGRRFDGLSAADKRRYRARSTASITAAFAAMPGTAVKVKLQAQNERLREVLELIADTDIKPFRCATIARNALAAEDRTSQEELDEIVASAIEAAMDTSPEFNHGWRSVPEKDVIPEILDEIPAEYCEQEIAAAIYRYKMRRLSTLTPAPDLASENERLRAALKSAGKALLPMADAVFNDNGDMTVQMPTPTYDECISAYFAEKRINAALERT